MKIDELIEKYKEQRDNNLDLIEEWEKEYKKTNDYNYKCACSENLSDMRTTKSMCDEILQDLEQLKEKEIK